MYWERSDIKSADLGRKHNEKPHKPFHCVSNAILFFNWNAGPTHWQCLIFSRHSGKRYPPFISVPFLPANYNFDLALIAKKFNKWGGGNPLEKKNTPPLRIFPTSPTGKYMTQQTKAVQMMSRVLSALHLTDDTFIAVLGGKKGRNLEGFWDTTPNSPIQTEIAGLFMMQKVRTGTMISEDWKEPFLTEPIFTLFPYTGMVDTTRLYYVTIPEGSSRTRTAGRCLMHKLSTPRGLWKDLSGQYSMEQTSTLSRTPSVHTPGF